MARTRTLKIMWKNRYSGDTGFVKAVRESKGYFENGTVDEARRFRTCSECNKAIELLTQLGEAENNDFMITHMDGSLV